MSVFRAAEVPFRSIKAHRPYPRLLFRVVRASSGPEVGHGRTPTDVLSDLLEERLVGPTAAQPDHDAAATHHDRRRHLDEQEPPGRRVPLAQRIVPASRVLVSLPGWLRQCRHGHVAGGWRRRVGNLPTQAYQ